MAARAAEEQAQAVQQLGRGAEGAAHTGYAGALVEREGGGNVEHLVDGSFACLREAAARVGGKRLEVAARPLGVENAQGKRALARAGHAGDGDESIERDVDVDVLEVVDACAMDLNARGHAALRA